MGVSHQSNHAHPIGCMIWHCPTRHDLGLLSLTTLCQPDEQLEADSCGDKSCGDGEEDVASDLSWSKR